ncbi:cyclic nucleotide-binding domain-containing protein [Deltaproteobacteria bacterium TL4]
MNWNKNQYYSFLQAEKSASAYATTLLQAYPLTRSCLEILGDKLINQLEFGFFSDSYEIIRQGEPGRDMFLLCEGKADVLVNGRVVVQMEGPTLLGDKALVEPKSIRAATIQVAKGETIPCIKIPMGRFIKNFGDKAIPDEHFIQEVLIFSHLFQAIQQRLFNYIYLQKNLWETVNINLNFANSAVIAKVLDNKKDLNWDDNIWASIKKFVSKELGFSWPDSVPLNIQTFRDGLWTSLDAKFPRNAYKGSDSDYILRKHLIWKTWLTQLSSHLTQLLPAESLPIHIKDLELFNPRNYHLRLSRLIRGIESKFKPKHHPHDPKATAVPVLSSFFGKGEHSNEFELQRYLESFEAYYNIDHPKRMLAQVAQRLAAIAAECENQFNGSVAKMQSFLEMAEKKFAGVVEQKAPSEDTSRKVATNLAKLLKGFPAFEKRATGILGVPGEIQVRMGVTPTIEDLIKSSAVKQTRTELENVFKELLEIFHLKEEPLSFSFFKNQVLLCKATQGDKVRFKELVKCYWIPLFEGVRLHCNGQVINAIKQGLLLGGPGWEISDQSLDCMLSCSKTGGINKEYLLLVVLASEFPWIRDKRANDADFVLHHVPLMQWLLNQHIAYLSFLLFERDRIFQKLSELDQVVRLEKKVKAFESTSTDFNSEQQASIQLYLSNTLGLPSNAEESINSAQLSKKIYNFILRQLGMDYPDMPVEERSNKAYTKWRFVLSELIKTLERLKKKDESKDELSTRPTFEVIVGEIKGIGSTYGIDMNPYVDVLITETPKLDFKNMMSSLGNLNPQKKRLIFKQMNSIFEANIIKTVQELNNFSSQLQQLQVGREESDADKLKTEILIENTKKLLKILGYQ